MATIRIMEPEDWPQVRQIYEQGIATGLATLETTPPEWPAWDATHVPDLRYVAVSEQGAITGWSALTPVSGRCVYAGVAEVSVYIGTDFRGQNLGDSLLKHLIQESENAGYWTLQASIFPENIPSIQLHLKNGFRLIGYRENIGQLHGVWRTVHLLERRSRTIGIN
ncbi:phosphinothricin acetyltransferase [Dyadobacter jejuensis]|uniref:Phosphinothricin acetyltransferase n=1 Tax=Dyadobacter jejuensis TaxID=1082580 RepID=A0A316ABD4_9BACT|nr:GNAT family N-acetyltransferase [Dyadobacter jejuensis]PWJ55023.1 phosphinothricin acetyltransferase [Dyadobacter jejuensis]